MQNGCDRQDVLRFDGMIVYGEGIRYWMGTTEEGLNVFIDRYINRDNIDVRKFEIYRNGEFAETIGDYLKRTRD